MEDRTRFSLHIRRSRCFAASRNLSSMRKKPPKHTRHARSLQAGSPGGWASFAPEAWPCSLASGADQGLGQPSDLQHGLEWEQFGQKGGAPENIKQS